MNEIKGEFNLQTLVTNKFNIIVFIAMIAMGIKAWLGIQRLNEPMLLTLFKFGFIGLILFLVTMILYYLLNPVQIIVNNEYVKIIKGKNEKVIKWDQVRKIKDERYNLGFSIYDENKHKTYVDFRTSNYAHIKEVMVKLHKENKHKAI